MFPVMHPSALRSQLLMIGISSIDGPDFFFGARAPLFDTTSLVSGISVVSSSLVSDLDERLSFLTGFDEGSGVVSRFFVATCLGVFRSCLCVDIFAVFLLELVGEAFGLGLLFKKEKNPSFFLAFMGFPLIVINSLAVDGSAD